MAIYDSAMQQILSGKVNNPYLDQQAQGIRNQVNDNLQQTILPGIGSGAMAAGQYGGSRQGIAQGLAIGQSNKYLSDALSNLYGGAQQQANQLQAGAAGQLSAQDAEMARQQAQIAAQQAMQTQNLGFQNQWQNQNFYTNNRGLDLQQAGLGANLFNQGLQGSLGLGQGISNIGQQQFQAPWQSLGDYSNLINPYTGLGGSQTSTSSQGGGVTGALGGFLAGSQLYNTLSGNTPGNPPAQPLGLGAYGR
jgi:hypothetical protein